MHMVQVCKVLSHWIIVCYRMIKKMGTAPILSPFISIHALKCLAPHFPWTHNQEEVITFYDFVCKMKKLEMFYPMPWDLHTEILYAFSKGLESPLMHMLHRTIQSNMAKCFSKNSSNKQWLMILEMIKNEGPMLFVQGVELLDGH